MPNPHFSDAIIISPVWSPKHPFPHLSCSQIVARNTFRISGSQNINVTLWFTLLFYWPFSLRTFGVTCECLEFEIEQTHFYNKNTTHTTTKSAIGTIGRPLKSDYCLRISSDSCDSCYLENSMIKYTFERNMWILSFDIWAKLIAILSLGDNSIGFCLLSSKRSTSWNGKTTAYVWSRTKYEFRFWFIYSNKWKWNTDLWLNVFNLHNATNYIDILLSILPFCLFGIRCVLALSLFAYRVLLPRLLVCLRCICQSIDLLLRRCGQTTFTVHTRPQSRHTAARHRHTMNVPTN